MSARARSKRRFQHAGIGCFSGRHIAVAAAAVLALATSAKPALAASAHATPGSTRRADTGNARPEVIVEKLRQLPLPLRPFPNGVASTKAAPPPLPALESRRQHVYAQLHAFGQASVPALARALRDPDPQMRRNVAVAMDVVGGGWWHFPDSDARLDLRPALPALLTALRDSDPGVRAWAAQDIGDIGGAAGAAVPALRAMLHSPDAESRGSACNALGALGSAAHAALPDLRRVLGDSSPEVREAAREAIAGIGRGGPGPRP
ncbi:MAG: HEAT repeat domain-containing protein [Steroidobacteraceae bacterium]